jgi:UPF0176 protein
MTRIAAFYRFVTLAAPDALAAALRPLCAEAGLTGSVILASEGVNATVAGPGEGIDRLLARLAEEPGLDDLRPAYAPAAGRVPFRRLRVRVRPEIVTLGDPRAVPGRRTGRRLSPRDWTALISGGEVAVVDARNAYEVAIGSFAGAIDPGLDRFRDFPAWWEGARARLTGRPVAMFCTGGIRCEKATSLALEAGAREVYQLDGGILRYLAEMPAAGSPWRGHCFVFDGRVSVGHGLVPGDHRICHACGAPVGPEGRAEPAWEEGVSCAACLPRYDAADRARFRARQRQSARA